MTNGFYLQNFLYLYSRNKHVIMENTRIKLSETVMVIDAAYLNFVINDLKKYFEPLLGRSLQRADLALFTMCLAMDAGVKEGSNDVQILLVYDEQSGKLEDCLPSDLKSELDGMAFKGPLGEFCFMAVSSEGFVSRGELYLDLLHIVLNSAEVKKLIVVPFNEEYGEEVENVLKELNIEKVDGIYLDLGVSSYQLDTASRGFTYREDAPLDMRMDQRNPTTAADIVNGYSEMELFHIIRDYGEDNFAKNIAKHIVKARAEKPIETTGELSEIIKAAIPAKVRATGGHPAKRTFQAIRIELNHELDVLENSIDTMIRLLNPEGRLSIITFHSLEDRIVKTRFRTNENPCICPPDFPVCVCGRKSMGKVITRKPILPSKEELEENSRSKSAKLRVFERAGKEE